MQTHATSTSSSSNAMQSDWQEIDSNAIVSHTTHTNRETSHRHPQTLNVPQGALALASTPLLLPQSNWLNHTRLKNIRDTASTSSSSFSSSLITLPQPLQPTEILLKPVLESAKRYEQGADHWLREHLKEISKNDSESLTKALIALTKRRLSEDWSLLKEHLPNVPRKKLSQVLIAVIKHRLLSDDSDDLSTLEAYLYKVPKKEIDAVLAEIAQWDMQWGKEKQRNGKGAQIIAILEQHLPDILTVPQNQLALILAGVARQPGREALALLKDYLPKVLQQDLAHVLVAVALREGPQALALLQQYLPKVPPEGLNKVLKKLALRSGFQVSKLLKEYLPKVPEAALSDVLIDMAQASGARNLALLQQYLPKISEQQLGLVLTEMAEWISDPDARTILAKFLPKVPPEELSVVLAELAQQSDPDIWPLLQKYLPEIPKDALSSVLAPVAQHRRPEARALLSQFLLDTPVYDLSEVLEELAKQSDSDIWPLSLLQKYLPAVPKDTLCPVLVNVAQHRRPEARALLSQFLLDTPVYDLSNVLKELAKHNDLEALTLLSQFLVFVPIPRLCSVLEEMPSTWPHIREEAQQLKSRALLARYLRPVSDHFQRIGNNGTAQSQTLKVGIEQVKEKVKSADAAIAGNRKRENINIEEMEGQVLKRRRRC